MFCGAGDRARTRDPRSTKPMLYQLSYTSKWSWNSESNRAPTLYESVTLPVELIQHRCHPETMAMSLTPPIQTHYDGSFDSVKGESWINHRGIRDCRDRKQALIPKMILAGAVGFEPTNGGFRIRCLNRTWRYPSPWCGRRDSNSHDSRHSHLKAARLPISPRPHWIPQFD